MMLLPASTEFAALCQSQISMMAEVIGADSTAVYLAESWSEQAVPKLIPIAVYPPAAEVVTDSRPSDKALPSASTLSLGNASGEKISQEIDPVAPPGEMPPEPEPLSSAQQISAQEQTSMSAQRLAIPLIHEGGVLGVLVSWRADRPWQNQDRDRMEECARSITLACVLDQRGQWLKSQLSSLDRVQNQQSDRFHELLHQLRSPLTALKTFGKLLAKRLPQDDRNQNLVINMLRESDRMQELLGYFDDTLQAADETREETSTTVPLLAPAQEHAATMEAEALPSRSDSLAHFGGNLNIQPCAVGALITPLLDLAKALAEAADMTFTIHSPSHESWVLTDGKALVEILNNFIDNSLKYSPSGTHIWVQWGLQRADQPGLSGILVGDTGPGIPQADQGHIFERHFRGVQATGDLEGSGLGLAIAHDLVRAMQGQIKVYSPLSQMPWPLPAEIRELTGVVGTAFVIWLPHADPQTL